MPTKIKSVKVTQPRLHDPIILGEDETVTVIFPNGGKVELTSGYTNNMELCVWTKQDYCLFETTIDGQMLNDKLGLI